MMARSIARLWQTRGGGASELAAAGRIDSEVEFRCKLETERTRTDRDESEFSIVALQILDPARRGQVMQALVDWLSHPHHKTDRAGWLGRDQLGICLPSTGRESAAAIAQAVAHACGADNQIVDWQVETFLGGVRTRAIGTNGSDRGRRAEVFTSDSRRASARTPASKLSPCPGWKRAIDVAGSFFGLAILSPALLAVAVWIKCVSRGPVFFRHQRYGLGGQPFLLWKFRSMATHNAPERHRSHVADLMTSDGPLVKIDDEMQFIRGGKLMRQLALDELPQLINVLIGEMSLVGPRPDVLPVEQYRVWQRRRFEVLPGITGLWQVSGKNQTTFSTMMRLDRTYVRRRCLWLDLKILLKTIPAIMLS
jgi:lipopolysaccharide/colanic/teichoic acid biosynthesis glycosyltransferase